MKPVLIGQAKFGEGCFNCGRRLFDSPIAMDFIVFCDRECAIEYVESWKEEQDARADELRKESVMPDRSDLD